MRNRQFALFPTHLTEKLSYNPKNFTPILMLASVTSMLVVSGKLPVGSMKELIAYAKSNPGKLNYGSFGIGTYAHLSMEDLKQRAGVDIVHVPYRGSNPAMTDLLAGNISMMIVTLSNIEPHEASGKIKILATAGTERVASRAQFPTIVESGVPGFWTSAWFGMFGPAGMPQAVVDKVHADASKVLDSKAVQDFFQKQTFNRMNLSPKEVGQLVDRDYAHWGKLIKSLGIKPE